MSSVTEAPRGKVPAGRSEWAQKYPPLVALAVALLIALVVLPSSLNLPQTNPTQTLEYAPVPPDEETDDAPPDGNFAALGLGSSSGIEGGGAGGGTGPGGGPPPAPLEGGGGVDANFRCVGKPPRQTEDPLAPPCVPFFEGDNGGATYQGVSANEVRLLVTLEGNINYISGSDASNRNSPANKIFDLWHTPEQCASQSGYDAGECNHLTIRGLRVWQEYFNQRFQTYGRNVHFYVAFSDGTGATPERRRAEAAQHLSQVNPFAVVSFYSEGAEDSYLEAMARKGVLNFGSFGLRPASFFNTFPAMIWSYLPSIEQQSQSYISYVCEKVVNKPAVLAGGGLRNQPRKLGLLHTNNAQNHPGLVKMAELVREGVEGCGGTIADTATFQNCCLAEDNGDPPNEEQQQMARFQDQGITTILWPGGGNGNYARSAVANGYLPEWILMGGDGFLDNPTYVDRSKSRQAFDGHAIAVTPHALQPALQQQRCYQFFREIDKSYDRADLGYVCEYYNNLFQFFVAVQVAGPYLGPSQIDKGFHAIPQKYNGDPLVPACFYLPGDYTCIKDAAAHIWSEQHTRPGGTQPGCYRAIEGGRRYAPNEWPAGNVNDQFRSDDPCSGYSESARYNLA